MVQWLPLWVNLELYLEGKQRSLKKQKEKESKSKYKSVKIRLFSAAALKDTNWLPVSVSKERSEGAMGNILLIAFNINPGSRGARYPSWTWGQIDELRRETTQVKSWFCWSLGQKSHRLPWNSALEEKEKKGMFFFSKFGPSIYSSSNSSYWLSAVLHFRRCRVCTFRKSSFYAPRRCLCLWVHNFWNSWPCRKPQKLFCQPKEMHHFW